jgi:acyl-CoA synthetase (AMP-forming)/AMP-acid ligase II
LGRKKDLIIKGGMNISPKRIEDFIIGLKIFDEVAILGIEEYYMGEKIVCFYLSEEPNLNDKIKSTNNQIVQKLGLYFKIDEFVKLKTLPKTPSGKINKPALKAKYDE